jgi:hypothetical protein
MKRTQTWILCALSLVALAMLSSELLAQGGPRGPGYGRGAGRGGRGPDADFAVDRDVFHFLLANGDKIERKVTNTKDGIETVTESDDPKIAAKIKEHVAAMYKRVHEQRPIHMRDPLFAEIFQHTKKIEMKVEKTDKGVKVAETSKDPYVAKLIQEHAKVVSLFVKNGFDEAHRNHAVPGKQTAGADAIKEGVPAAGCCCGKGKCCKAEKGGKCPNCSAGKVE